MHIFIVLQRSSMMSSYQETRNNQNHHAIIMIYITEIYAIIDKLSLICKFRIVMQMCIACYCSWPVERLSLRRQPFALRFPLNLS